LQTKTIFLSTVFGSASAPPRGEWTRTGITYAHHAAEYPFGLRCPKNATRGLQSVIQAFLIKYFIFDNRPKEKSIPLEKMLKPTESEQSIALWNSISEILWNVGEKTVSTSIAMNYNYFINFYCRKQLFAYLEICLTFPIHTVISRTMSLKR